MGSASILMDVNNGEILSMVSLPDFDLNKRETIKDLNYINRATKGVYELGSVFKTFTLAAGLENKKIKSSTIFKNLESKIYCAGSYMNGNGHRPPDLLKNIPKDGVRGLWTYWNQSGRKRD